MAFSGNLNFNPTTDTIPSPNGPFRFSPPTGDRLPTAGFTPGDLSYSPMPSPQPVPETEIVISSSSQRLEILEPFGNNFLDGQGELPEMTCLMRVRGKWSVSDCTSDRTDRFDSTTDHISAAGAWLKVCISNLDVWLTTIVQRPSFEYLGEHL